MKKNKKENEVCPEDNDPMYCKNCFKARVEESKRKDKISRKKHGLNTY